MSHSSATASAAMSTATSGNLSGKKKTVINELEKVLMKGRFTPEGKQNDRTEKEKKQIINENLLAARQRWLTHNRIKTESIAALAAASSSAGGSEESEDDEPPMMVQQRGLTYSCEPALNTRIEKMDTIEVRANRAYSNTTFPQRIIPKPPNNPPPPLNVQVGTSPAGSASVSPNVRTQAAHKTPKETRKESSSSSATTSKMKKIFNFKPKKKKKRRTKKMTSIPPTRTGSVKGARSSKGEGRLPAQKSMSDSSLAKLNVLVSTSSLEEDGLIPINVPSLGYQNVFDNPEFAKYTQKSPNRSNTSSPMEVSLSAKPPKPLPRSVANGESLGRTNMISTGSERDTDQETPPPYHTKIPIISPLLSSSPNSECLTPAFPLPLDDDGITTDSIPPIEIHAEDSTNTISRPRINTKERLTKTVSCNPDSSGGWDIKRRGSSLKQKELRRGVCSEGPAEDDDEDDEYITIPAALGVGAFHNSELHRANKDFLSVRGKVNSKDSKRLSAEYLKLIPLETDSNPSSPSSSRQTTKRRPPPPRPLQKVKTVPAFSDHPQLRSRKTSQGIDTNYNSADSPTDRQATRSASPSQSTDQFQSQKYHMESSISTQRNLQYISVSVNTSEKKRKPSVPKKYKYQVVNIDENGDPRMTQSTDVGNQSTEQQESSAARPELFSQGQQPTTNLASTGENTSSGNSNVEHRYYVNRNSVQIPENSDNLPTTMLKTMDPLTGKIIWHEYVEIDEEEIDQIASRMGVSPSNITSTTQETPEKLEVLLSNVESNDGLNDSSEAMPSASNTAGSGSTTPERVIDDSHLSGTSTASSECKYVLNINDPPTVPPRPEILDDLCDEEECRSSGDYSYAFIPGAGARWIMPGGHVSPKMMITPPKETCAVSESSLNFKHQVPESSPVQLRASNSSKDSSQNLTINEPPSLPPKTDSLMREQQSLTNNGKVFPFLPDIIVRTRKSNIQLFQPRRAPPKVIPYKDHQKQKMFPANHPARLHTSSPNEASAASIIASEGLETKKQHNGQRTHKKLARQRSHGRRSYRKAATKTKDATRKPHLEVELETKKTSKAESVARKLMETLSIDDAAVKTTKETEHENSTKTQGLSKILNDLGQLLKSSNYSESDILSAIESHLKQGVKNEPKESLPQSIAVENSERDSTKYSDDEYGEPESWLSGEEPESEAELETSIPITFSPFSVTPSKPMDEDDSEAELDLKNIYESKRLIRSRESNDYLEYEEMASLPIFDRSISNDSKTHSYVNLQYGTEPKIYEHDESKRYSYVDMDIESNLDHLIQASPTIKIDNSRFQSSDDTDPKPTASELGSASVSLRERSKSSSARNTQSVINPRSSRTQSNPDSELADAVFAGMVQGRTDNAQPMPRKNKSLPELRKHKILREETSLQMADTSNSERTLSYRLALQMEDILLSQSAEVNTSRRRLSAVREEGKFQKTFLRNS